MRSLFFIFALCFSCTITFSQTHTIDSIQIALKKLPEDSTKVKAYFKIAEEYLPIDNEKVIEFANRGLSLAKKINWRYGIGIAYAFIGEAYRSLGNYPLALTNQQQELLIWEELHNETKLCIIKSNIGATYSDLGNFLKAVEYYFESLSLAEKLGNVETLINANCNIGSLYTEMGDDEKAILYYNKALNLAIKTKQYKQIGLVYGNLGNIYLNPEKVELAQYYYRKAIAADEQNGITTHMSAWLSGIGNYHRILADSFLSSGNLHLQEIELRKGEEYLRKALNAAVSVKNKFLEVKILGNLSGLLVERNQFAEAEKALIRSHEISDSIGVYDGVEDYYFRSYELYKRSNNLSKALHFFEMHQIIKDSLSNIENKKAVHELEMQYESVRKESDIKLLTKEKDILMLKMKNDQYLTIALIAISVLIVAVGFIYIHKIRLKSRKENEILSQKLLRTQMNPHFIFNSLSSIESFIYENKPKIAGDYLARFAKLMRLTLEYSDEESITLSSELEMLRYYLDLQKLRLNDNMSFEIIVDEKIQPDRIKLPPMLIQPFVENTIEHAFRGMNEEGKIKIMFEITGKLLQIKIIDNGIGIDSSLRQKENFQTHKSRAIRITKQRLALIRKLGEQEASISIKDIACNGLKGTEVLFSIPI